MTLNKHMHYRDDYGWRDHGRYLEAKVGDVIHPFHNVNGPVNFLVKAIDDSDPYVIKVLVEKLSQDPT